MYEVAIIGGGLAGLGLAIQMADLGHNIVLLEKEKYPFHKVCGEYISMESWDFLERCGIDLSALNLPLINQLVLSDCRGKTLKHALNPGGFGISRFLLDKLLVDLAKAKGVEILENTKVEGVEFREDIFEISTANSLIKSKLVAGSWGKRSNLDIKLNRGFTHKKPTDKNHFIGVKYHVQADFNSNEIALHNFENGYCGISKIDNNQFCVCYLTTAKNLQNFSGDIKKLEGAVLYKNPVLKSSFESFENLYEKPLVIAQVSFAPKEIIHRHVLLLGDAAGLITPLCGNGMSMAMHASVLASPIIHQYLNNKIDRNTMELAYAKSWKKEFANRLSAGRYIQKLFGNPLITNTSIGLLKLSPGLTNFLVKQTHGKSY